MLLSAVLLLGNFGLPVYADGEEDPLKPGPNSDESGNVTVLKQAERIAPDEWEVTVTAEIKDQPIEPPQLEVTFVLDASKSMLMCAEEYLHNNYFRTHYFHSSCPLICTDTSSSHVHVDACYGCGMRAMWHSVNDTCHYYIDGKYGLENEFDFVSRLDIATQVMMKMEAALPVGTRVGRVAFSDNDYAQIFTSYSDIPLGGSTYMMDGVRLALDPNPEKGTRCFSDDPTTRKIMIILSDGEPSDYDFGASDPTFQAFRNNGGIVYTVGFNYDNPNLIGMTANGGTYSQASNPDELEFIFDHITYELTAMIKDPMGSTVNFDQVSANQPASVSGNITVDNDSNTLYWHPENNSSITNSSISYQYIVKLNSNASMTPGIHSGVPLNDTTSLLYGIPNLGMQSLEFNIPHATYAVSTMQVNWKAGDLDLKTPTATESVICDFGEPAFTTDYTTVEPFFTVGGKTYYYTGTVITKNGAETDSVNIKDAAAFVVTHQYTEEVRYSVTYAYTGEVPAGAPDPSANNSYGLKAGMEMTVAGAPALEGYVFSGWEAVTGSIFGDGTIRITDADVTLVGRWAKLNGYRVTANYYTVTDGGSPVQDNEAPVLVAEDLKTVESSVDLDLSAFYTFDGNTYDSVTAEGAAQIDGHTLKGIVPADPAAEIVLTFLREIRNPYTVTVRYVDDAGETLLPDDVSAPILSGDDYDVTVKALPTVRTEDGRVLDFVSDNGAAYEGTLTDHSIEIVRTYLERGTATITVLYVNEAGDELMTSSNSGDVYVGEPYDVSSAERFTTIVAEDGKVYVFDRDGGAAYTGVMPDSDFTITRVYREKDKATATVRFVDEDGNKLTESVSETVYVDSSYNLYTEGNVPTITTEDGRIYDFVSDDNAVYAGKMPAEGVVIIRVYGERAKATITVTFVDEDGNALRDPMTKDVYVDTEFDVTEAKELSTVRTEDGKLYDFVSDDGAEYTGTMTENGINITRTYKERGKAVVTVHYVNNYGTQMREDTTSGEVYIGEPYDVSEAETFTVLYLGDRLYDFAEDGGAVYTGAMPEGGAEFTRLYRERAKASATVYFVDEDGNTVREPMVETVYVDTEFDISEADHVNFYITGDGTQYEFVGDGDAVYTGTMTENGIEITRVYRECDKATITVSFVDEEGNVLRDPMTENVYVDAFFDISEVEDITSITADGKIYDFVGDENADYDGTMTAQDINITRTYKERAKAEVIVHYVDDKGNKLQDDTSSGLIYVGSDYDVTDADERSTITVDGKIYDLVTDGDAEYTGTMPEGGAEITRTYKEREKREITIRYEDENGNTLLTATYSGPIYIGEAYDVSAAKNVTTIEYFSMIFDFSHDGDAEYTGNMPAEGGEIVRVYKERAKATVTIHYVNEEGDTLIPDMVFSPIYIGTPYDVSDYQLETIVAGQAWVFKSDSNAAYEGLMTEGGIEITRVYTEMDKGAATVHYVDEEGNPLREDTVSPKVYLGVQYDVSEAEAVETITTEDGKIYDFFSDNDAEYTGSMPEGGLTIVRVYKERARASIVIHYVDEEGNRLREDIARENVYVGEVYGMTPANLIYTIETGGKVYDFVTDGGAEYTVTLPPEGIEITRVYREREKVTVTVQYVDSEGNALRADTVTEGYYTDNGQTYDVSSAEEITSITKDGKIYDFVSDDDAEYTGEIFEDAVVITRVYEERAKATITVRYVDKDGKKLMEPVNELVYVGTHFDVTAAKTETISASGKTYTFSSDNGAVYEGTMSAESIEITRIYKLKTSGTGTGTATPETGDKGIGLWLALLLVSAGAAAMLIPTERRRFFR